MAIFDLWLSRNNGPTVSNYVGHAGRLFYDPAERVLRISNGSTAGGEVFNGIVTVANTAPTTNFPGQLWLNPQTYDLSVYHNNAFVPTINLATSTNIGGVKLGPGVTVNGEGQLIIDSEGLDFSFGDLASTTETYAVGHPNAGNDYAVLSTINADEDFYLVSNGTGSIDVVGEFKVYKTDGNVAGAIESEPIFKIKGDGQIQMLVPGADSEAGALTIVGSLSGEYIAPVNTGVMMHITGNYGSPGIPSRIYNDSQNAFGAWVTRRFNGTVLNPTAVLANEEIMRLSGTAHNGTTIPGTGNQRIIYTALGNQTLTNQGGAIELWTTPINTTTIAKIATVNSIGITLESGKVLTGNVTGNVSGTAATVTTAAQPAITSVGTLTSLEVNNLVTAKNYSGQARNAGTLGAAGTLTIDFATDHNVLVNLTSTATIAFSNITSGKTVTVMVKNNTGGNRAITTGVLDINTSGGNAAPNVNDQRTGVFVYRTFGTATTDIYCEVNP